MTEQNSGVTSAADALDIAVGTAVAAALVDDGPAEAVGPARLPPSCLNCGAAVSGRYCAACGQITDTHVPTLAEVLGDAITSIFNLDSRLWRTLLTLFFRPGLLTQDFLTGKRARYVPPLRLYLVLSVVLFLVFSLDPQSDDDKEQAPRDTSLDQQEETALQRELETQVDERIAQALGPLVMPGDADAAAPMPQGVEASPGAATAEAGPDVDGDVDLGPSESGSVTLTNEDGTTVELDEDYDCDEMKLPVVDRGDMIDSAMREACRADNFDSIADAFRDNIPLLTFMVIPVMALVFKLFYAFSSRNYLAHLVFLCHTHAFTFLVFVVLALMRLIGAAAPALYTAMAIIGGLLFALYLPIYYFLAMRRVYGQGVMLTLVKQLTLMFLYLVVTTIVFAVGFVVVMLAS